MVVGQSFRQHPQPVHAGENPDYFAIGALNYGGSVFPLRHYCSHSGQWSVWSHHIRIRRHYVFDLCLGVTQRGGEGDIAV